MLTPLNKNDVLINFNKKKCDSKVRPWLTTSFSHVWDCVMVPPPSNTIKAPHLIYGRPASLVVAESDSWHSDRATLSTAHHTQIRPPPMSAGCLPLQQSQQLLRQFILSPVDSNTAIILALYWGSLLSGLWLAYRRPRARCAELCAERDCVAGQRVNIACYADSDVWRICCVSPLDDSVTVYSTAAINLLRYDHRNALPSTLIDHDCWMLTWLPW